MVAWFVAFARPPYDCGRPQAADQMWWTHGNGMPARCGERQLWGQRKPLGSNEETQP
jgi:hypothetical protein